jgi:ABC-2 type transport system ATP-binding protein
MHADFRNEAPALHAIPALDISNLSHRYGDRQALHGVAFTVAPGEIFGLLGPNGGGKTTLFRIVSTLLRPSAGGARVFGMEVVGSPARVRRQLGVVFQSPALDPHLTVAENLRHHGHLYGVYGQDLRQRIAGALARVRLEDRAGDLVMTLSGGLQRRAELAKALLHDPKLLILDEPTTGLDPGARRDLWDHLRALRERDGRTIVLTTHLMEEAATCDRVGILHEGHLVASGAPEALISEIGGDVLLIAAPDPPGLAARIRERFGVSPDIMEGQLRLERARAHEFIPPLVEAFPGEIDSVTFSKPTLDDVFIHHTGHRL